MTEKMSGIAMSWTIFKMKILDYERCIVIVDRMTERFMILTYNIKKGIWCLFFMSDDFDDFEFCSVSCEILYVYIHIAC